MRTHWLQPVINTLVGSTWWMGLCLCAAGILSAAEKPAGDPNQLSDEEAGEGFVQLFDGKTLNGWTGAVQGYQVRDGVLVCDPGGNLFTEKQYDDFIFRFEFKLPPGGNNGVGIRSPLKGNPAYAAMEIQILDDGHPKYAGWLKPYQVHGSIYGVVPAKRGCLKPAGQWNSEEIYCKGSHVRVTVNGQVVVDVDLSTVDKPADGRSHPGLHNKRGHIGFLGHGDPVEFRHIRIKELK